MKSPFWKKWWPRHAPLGSPENPEILDPLGARGKGRSVPGVQSRWKIAGTLLRVAVMMTVPAAGFDFACRLCFDWGRESGNILPWLGVLVLILPAAVLTLIAVVVDGLVFISILFISFGKPMIQVGQIRFGGNPGPFGPRDVSPTSSESWTVKLDRPEREV